MTDQRRWIIAQDLQNTTKSDDLTDQWHQIIAQVFKIQANIYIYIYIYDLADQWHRIVAFS